MRLNEVYRQIIYCLNYIRHHQNATSKLALTYMMGMGFVSNTGT